MGQVHQLAHSAASLDDLAWRATPSNQAYRRFLPRWTHRLCPNYLRSENQGVLRERMDRLKPYTGTVANFLRENPGCYSHYVLLDHQDWLAWNDPLALREEWDLILANSRPGTKILMRSAGLDLSFVPDEIRARLRFQPERTEATHQLDRVGTYGSTHFAEVIA